METNFSSIFDFILYIDNYSGDLFIPAILVGLNIVVLSVLSPRKSGLFTTGSIMMFLTFGLNLLIGKTNLFILSMLFLCEALLGVFLHLREVFQ